MEGIDAKKSLMNIIASDSSARSRVIGNNNDKQSGPSNVFGNDTETKTDTVPSGEKTNNASTSLQRNEGFANDETKPEFSDDEIKVGLLSRKLAALKKYLTAYEEERNLLISRLSSDEND